MANIKQQTANNPAQTSTGESSKGNLVSVTAKLHPKDANLIKMLANARGQSLQDVFGEIAATALTVNREKWRREIDAVLG